MQSTVTKPSHISILQLLFLFCSKFAFPIVRFISYMAANSATTRFGLKVAANKHYENAVCNLFRSKWTRRPIIPKLSTNICIWRDAAKFNGCSYYSTHRSIVRLYSSGEVALFCTRHRWIIRLNLSSNVFGSWGKQIQRPNYISHSTFHLHA